VGGFNLKLKKEPTIEEVKVELQNVLALRRWRELVFCGFGEPTARLDVLLQITRWIRKQYDDNIRIRIDTNGHGYKLNEGRDVAKELRDVRVDRVSISLNGYDEASYAENCRPGFSGGFAVVLDFIKRVKSAGLDVEISALRMPEVNIEKVRKISESLGVTLRIRDYLPVCW
jgi:cyclic pyranopterin phosphate synthase